MRKTLTTVVNLTPDDIKVAITEYLKQHYNFTAVPSDVTFDVKLVTRGDDRFEDTWSDPEFKGAQCTVLHISDK